jgi:predicted unusual protein kinase regulating ubiquinone biosynthesis (AarF/ABC1/UbiB family)
MVGHIRAEVWQAVFDFFTAVSASDYNRVARSMVTIGITRDAVDIHQLEEDIKQLFEWIQTQNRPGYDYSDYETEINRLVSELGDIARRYGIRFPRAFTLLLKQFLYFDRYLGLMAPGVDLFGDDRIQTHL